MSAKYRDYDVVLGEDHPLDCYYAENQVRTNLLRVHYRVTRVPSTKTITLRHLRGATAEDRARAEAEIPRLRTSFASWESIGAAHRRRLRGNERCAIFIVMGGSPVEDPLIQLELEMMIDGGKDDWLSEAQTADALGVTVGDLALVRQLRTGPAYYRPNLRTVVYNRAEVDVYRADVR